MRSTESPLGSGVGTRAGVHQFFHVSMSRVVVLDTRKIGAWTGIGVGFGASTSAKPRSQVSIPSVCAKVSVKVGGEGLLGARVAALSRTRLHRGEHAAGMTTPPGSSAQQLSKGEEERKRLDDQLSKRRLALDPAGYFIIYLDRAREEIVADHYRNVINDKGIACDPKTGKPIPCDGSYKPAPNRSFRGKTAKELSVAILEMDATGGETAEEATVSLLSHANYLGREFQKAEAALISGEAYVQD
ncbi:hypothetical protein CBR_g937 [Chara braunii]|uniref:DUF4346 domain-containing protein n=1 Tax=Chara braunii TaxID=69332 RepID=A0A388KCT0_CHABU|nr:hypothetical protein CBR_g937 [Chara braunii]|eukprot:GBG67816.1 hypothetical protein CBR_g937 [Chara braunii]